MPRIYECQKCQKQFTKKYNLISHLNRKFSCDNLKTIIYNIDNNKPILKPIAEEVAEEVEIKVAEKIAEIIAVAEIKENAEEIVESKDLINEYDDYVALQEIAKYITEIVGCEQLVPYSDHILEEGEIKEAENKEIVDFGDFFEANQYLRAKTNMTNTSKYRKRLKNGKNNRFNKTKHL